MLSEISQREKGKNRVVSCMWGYNTQSNTQTKQTNAQTQTRTWWLPEGKRVEENEGGNEVRWA